MPSIPPRRARRRHRPNGMKEQTGPDLSEPPRQVALEVAGRPGRHHAIGVMIAAPRRRMMSPGARQKDGARSNAASFRLDRARRAGGLPPGSVEEVDRMAVTETAHPNIDERRAKGAVQSGRLATLEDVRDRRLTMANRR